MFVQVKRNETWEEGNWSNFELFSFLELIVLEWRIDQMAGTSWRKSKFTKMIHMTNQAEKPNDCHDFGKKIEFFSFSVLGQKLSWKNVRGSFR